MAKWAAWILWVVVLTIGGIGAFIYSGVLDVGADEPHWPLTAGILAAVRDRSIAIRAARLTVPNLTDPGLVALGAEHYEEMCTGCHLAPGKRDTNARRGLNPQPPQLALPRARTPAETFWIIKHGIRMTGMPAWGATHDDRTIWGLVAFIQQLPTTDAAGYARLTGSESGRSDGQDHADREHRSDQVDDATDDH